MTIWKTAHSYEDKTCLCLSCGPVQIWVERTGQIWRIAKKYETGPDGQILDYDSPPSIKPSTAPEDVEWERWAANPNDKDIRFTPCLPDRPIVARPQEPLRVPAHHSCTIYVRIPLWIKIETGPSSNPTLLTEIPCVASSNTWFGSPESGELCYSLLTRARNNFQSNILDPHRAFSKVTIINKSNDEMLNFERVCIRAPSLTLYPAIDRFWTNDVQLSFRGQHNKSDIRYAEKAPKVDGVGPAICKPREALHEGILHASFSDIKSWVYS